MKQNAKRAFALTAITLAATTLIACGDGGDSAPPPAPDPLAKAPTSMKITWFGISNYHYQLGDVGIMLDGETVSSGSAPNVASVTKAHNSIKRIGTIDAILVGHDHGDHSLQVPEWAKQTGKPVYAPATICTKMVAYGLPASQCTPLKGGETFKVGDFVTVHAVRYVHSVDCGAPISNGTGGPETFGYLITSQTTKKDEVLSLFVNDSGAGGPDLTIPRVANGVTYGAPLTNLFNAFKKAGLSHIDVWQVGPEARVINQVRVILPAFDVRAVFPTHQNQRSNTAGSYNLERGVHYVNTVDDMPKLKAFLDEYKVPQYLPTNYWDRWEYTKAGITKIENTAVKADYGIPATGTGPGPLGPNPRAGALECAGD